MINKMALAQFIRKEGGKMNLTYSVKYYGVDEGQIGILSRKVPFEEFVKTLRLQSKDSQRMMEQPERSLKLPKIDYAAQRQVQKTLDE